MKSVPVNELFDKREAKTAWISAFQIAPVNNLVFAGRLSALHSVQASAYEGNSGHRWSSTTPMQQLPLPH